MPTPVAWPRSPTTRRCCIRARWLWERRDDIAARRSRPAPHPGRRCRTTWPRSMRLATPWPTAPRATQEALELIDRARVAEPDNAAIIDSYGWVLYRLGRNDEALVQLRRAYTAAEGPGDRRAPRRGAVGDRAARTRRGAFRRSRKLDPDNRALQRALREVRRMSACARPAPRWRAWRWRPAEPAAGMAAHARLPARRRSGRDATAAGARRGSRGCARSRAATQPRLGDVQGRVALSNGKRRRQRPHRLAAGRRAHVRSTLSCAGHPAELDADRRRTTGAVAWKAWTVVRGRRRCRASCCARPPAGTSRSTHWPAGCAALRADTGARASASTVFGDGRACVGSNRGGWVIEYADWHPDRPAASTLPRADQCGSGDANRCAWWSISWGRPSHERHAGPARAGRHWPAPAKLNLFLHITGRRADGYHPLQTVFRLLDWGDTIRLRVRDDGRIVRDRRLGAPGVAEADDLAVRAAKMLQNAAKCAARCRHLRRKAHSGGRRFRWWVVRCRHRAGGA